MVIPKPNKLSLKRSKIAAEETFLCIEKIKEYFKEVSGIINGIDPSLLLNLDESGFIPFADGIDELVAVDASKFENISIPIDRCIRRITLLGGVAADNTTIKPFIISHRKTLEKK